jgi:hypothetical protein
MPLKQSTVSIWFSLVLSCIFALCALLVVFFGSKVYAAVLDDAAQNDLARTATLYIANKVRAHDCAGGVNVGAVEDAPALVLRRQVEADTVVTYLYLYRGTLCEVSTLLGAPVVKAAGQAVLPLHTFDFNRDERGLLHVRVADDGGHTAAIALFLRSAGAVP